MQSYSVEAVLKATNADQFAKSFSNAAKNVGNLEKAAGKMKGVGSSLTNKITKPAAIAAGVVGGLVSVLGFKRLVGLDTAKAKLKGLGYNAEEVKNITGQVTDAIEGGMTTMAEGVDIAAGALAAGIDEGEDLKRYVGLVGDAAVGANRPVDEMAQIFNRVQGGGRLMTQELNMIEQGMPGFAQAMADNLADGSLESFREMVTNGEVGSDEFLNVMDDFAGGMADAYSDSWAGMTKNTLAYVGIIGEALLEGLFEDGKEGLASFIEVLKSDGVMEWAERTGETIKDVAQTIVGVVTDIKNVWDELSPGVQDIIKKVVLFGGIALVVLGPILTIAGKIMLAWPMIAGVFKAVGVAIGIITTPVGLVVAAIIAAATLIFIYWEPIKEFFLLMWEMIKDAGIAIWGFLQDVWESTVEILMSIWEPIKEFFLLMWEMIKDAGIAIWGFLQDVWESTVEILMSIWEPIAEFFTGLWETVSDIFTGAWEGLTDMLSEVWSGIEMIASGAWDLIISVILAPILLLIKLATGDFEGFEETLSSIWGKIKESASLVWEGLKVAVMAIVDSLVKVVTKLWNGLKKGLSSILDGILRIAKNVWDNIVRTVKRLAGNVKDAAIKAWDTLKTETKKAFNKVVDFIKDPLGDIDLYQIGKDIIQGMINGIGAMGSAVWSAAKGIASSVKDSVTGFFGIKSPSRLMAELGEFLGEGLAGGIEDSEGIVSKAAMIMSESATITPQEFDIGGSVAGINRQAERQLSHTFDSNISVDKQPAIINVHVGTKRVASEIVGDITSLQNQASYARNKSQRR